MQKDKQKEYTPEHQPSSNDAFTTRRSFQTRMTASALSSLSLLAALRVLRLRPECANTNASNMRE
jgi:hypothetical protein